MFTEHLLCAKQALGIFTHTSSFNPHRDARRYMDSILVLYMKNLRFRD